MRRYTNLTGPRPLRWYSWWRFVVVLVATLQHCANIFPTQTAASSISGNSEAARHSVQTLNRSLALLLQMNASCGAAVKATCTRIVRIADIFAATGGGAECEKYIATLKGGTLPGCRRERINSCSESITSWRADCFESAKHCSDCLLYTSDAADE